MFITPKFVYIHMPKTGGTFVTSALLRLHNCYQYNSTSPSFFTRFFEKTLKNYLTGKKIEQSNSYGIIIDLPPKHNTCHDIPKDEQNKLILSSVRNPYDWYVSQYEFSWWKRTFMYDPQSPESKPTPVGFAIESVLPSFQNRYPHFPNISFSEFVGLCTEASLIYDQKYKTSLGLYTHGFIRFYYRDIEGALSSIKANNFYISSGEYKSDMFNVHFLKTNYLNQELYSFLLSMDYRRKDIEFLLNLGKIFPEVQGEKLGRREGQHWESYYTPTLKQIIREKDWMIFEMFPDFDT